MKIYTRTGDRGETSLMGGGRVSKDHLRVSAYGDVDETNAAIGLVRVTAPAEFATDLLASIQHDLFTIGGAIATPEPDRLKQPQRDKVVIGGARIAALETAAAESDIELEQLCEVPTTPAEVRR